MNKPVDRRQLLRAGIALCASLALPSARACEFYTSTLRVTHPWSRATTPGATFAVLCMKFDEVSETDRLIGVGTPVAAGAELVGGGADGGLDLLIPQGQETVLTEEGMHIRLVGLQQPLLLGRAYPLDLVFDKGGVVSAKLNIDYQGMLSSFPSRLRP